MRIASKELRRIFEIMGKAKEGFGAAIHLRLRTPARQKIKTVEVNGKPWTNFEPKEETVILPAGSNGRITIEVTT